MKKKIIEISFILMGIILIAYPIISVCISSYNQTIAISNYQETIDKLSEKEKEDELEKARKYNEEMGEIVSVDISLSTPTEDDEYVSYFNVLNIGEAMAYISIPKIDAYLPIYHGLSEEVLQSGVGHLETTALPVGGLGTHCVLAGHTGLVRTKIFDDINKLEEKDKFYIYVLGETLTYEVDKIDVVLPENTDTIVVEKDKDYITLVTCTPYMINTHRLLVRGVRVQNEEIELENIENKTDIKNINENRRNNIVISIIIFVVITIILMRYILINRKIKSQKKSNKYIQNV